MDIIVLLSFGFLLLGFILLFRKKHQRGFEQLMQENKNVPQLFKERSAQIKFDALCVKLRDSPIELQALTDLQNDFRDNRIGIDQYNEQLYEMTAQIV